MKEILLALALVQATAEANPPVPVEEIQIVEEMPDPVTGEFAVDPYAQSNANAGANPFFSPTMADQFGGKSGIRALTTRLVELSLADPHLSDIFKGHDLVRFRRVLFEQFCYILAAGCNYSGRDMRAAHANMGLQRKDLNALVESLQLAMKERRIPFATQNKLLAKLAPMDKAVLQK